MPLAAPPGPLWSADAKEPHPQAIGSPLPPRREYLLRRDGDDATAERRVRGHEGSEPAGGVRPATARTTAARAGTAGRRRTRATAGTPPGTGAGGTGRSLHTGTSGRRRTPGSGCRRGSRCRSSSWSSWRCPGRAAPSSTSSRESGSTGGGVDPTDEIDPDSVRPGEVTDLPAAISHDEVHDRRLRTYQGLADSVWAWGVGVFDLDRGLGPGATADLTCEECAALADETFELPLARRAAGRLQKSGWQASDLTVSRLRLQLDGGALWGRG